MEEISLIYDTLSIKEKEDFTRVCNKLLSNCLICRYKEATKKDYYFIERNSDAINEYFQPIGYEVEVNKTIKAAQLVNKLGINKFKLNLITSITALILRILYFEKMQELSLSNLITVEIDEIQNKFIALGFKNKLMDKTALNNSLRTLKKFNIIDNIDSDMARGDSRILIYPTIQMLIRSQDISTVFEKLDTYKRKGVTDNEEINNN